MELRGCHPDYEVAHKGVDSLSCNDALNLPANLGGWHRLPLIVFDPPDYATRCTYHWLVFLRLCLRPSGFNRGESCKPKLRHLYLPCRFGGYHELACSALCQPAPIVSI